MKRFVILTTFFVCISVSACFLYLFDIVVFSERNKLLRSFFDFSKNFLFYFAVKIKALCHTFLVFLNQNYTVYNVSSLYFCENFY